ncbi:peptidyl-glycine alpha-amidating monooxygenase isoform l precursor [Homo sapiens]|uniref:peptidyl-glycine alpha-amidating monooxygenase isoform l precursor n=1 Tax=Homo sapiens TaxID=9606 RepID=UPI0007DC5CA1|nr:peptidyl-glycine alpha-amidating monooxygenase isoform l precursor [Homo sapiens]|eukprot:XP_016864997.1 peptidyl-glycine alpha-amidating monooxygenase isoform X18 [Homo sapiens]
MAGRVPSLLVLLVFPSSCLAFRSPLSVFKRFKETTRPFSNECLGTTRPVVPIDSSDFALDIRMPGVTPKQSDTYFCMSMRIPVDEEAFVIDFKPRASMDTVHHMLLFGCNMPSSTGSYWFCDEGTCTDKANILYAWARNAPPTRLPKGVGFRVGGETGSKYFVLQVHYGDISAFRDNNKDCSGVSLHLTRLPQPLIAGMYLMMSVDTVIPAGEKVVNSDISCHYKNYPMHVFAYRVHTHHLGKVVSGYRVRNGQWTLIGRQSPQLPQAFYPVGHPVDVSFGDLLAARCVFTGEGRTEATHIGGTSSDEMCNLYIMYYMEAKHAVSFMTCTQNVAPDMFRTIPPEANIPIPVKSDMVMMHEHHKETEYKDKIPLLQQPKREEEEVLDQDFHMEEALDWPGVYLLPGQVSGVALDPKNNLVIFHRGDHVWDGNSFDSKFVYQQIGLGPIEEDTILVIDPNNAAVLQSSGKNLFYLPHGLSIDKDGNYWVTDVALHQVFKLDPNNKEGPVLILGRSMQPGSDQNHFCQPTDVAVDPGTGAIYVSDGYCNSRIVQFSPSGKFITQWGEESSGSSPLPGQFTVPHSLALVPLLGQLCVADRENGRIQCFKTDTKEFVREIKHSSFGRNVFAISYIPGLLFAVNGKPHFGDQEPVQGFVMNFSNGEIIDIFKPVRKHFDMPHDIVASEDGTVYIGDAHTNTVWKFTLTEKLEHRSVKKAGIEVQEIKAEAVVETKMENKPTSSELQKMQEKQKLIKEPGSGVPVVLITTLLVIPVVVLLAIAIFIRWKKSRAFGADSEHKLETSSGRVLGRFRGKGSGGLNLGNFFASRKGYSRKGFDRLSTEGSDQEKEDDGSESEEEYSAPLPALAPSSS